MKYIVLVLSLSFLASSLAAQVVRSRSYNEDSLKVILKDSPADSADILFERGGEFCHSTAYLRSLHEI